MALCVAMCWEMVAMAGFYAGGENNSLRPLTLTLNCKIIDADPLTIVGRRPQVNNCREPDHEQTERFLAVLASVDQQSRLPAHNVISTVN